MSKQQINMEIGQSLLCFYLGNDPYAVDLETVREISEIVPTQAVANTVESFSGLMNLRGELIGVIDLRVRFGYPVQKSDYNAFIVFETERGPLAVTVDRLERVQSITSAQAIKQANIPSPVKREFVLGVADFSGKIFQVIDLKKILSLEELIKVSGLKEVA